MVAKYNVTHYKAEGPAPKPSALTPITTPITDLLICDRSESARSWKKCSMDIDFDSLTCKPRGREHEHEPFDLRSERVELSLCIGVRALVGLAVRVDAS